MSALALRDAWHGEDERAARPRGETLQTLERRMELAARPAAARQRRAPGRDVLAVHCRQTRGGQYVDVGRVGIVPSFFVNLFGW